MTAATKNRPKKTDDLLADDLHMVVTRLARRLRRLVSEQGLSPTMHSILTTLARGGPLTHGELAAAERVRPPTITAAIDKLQDEGLVIRERDTVDRRVTRVAITETGRELLVHSREERTAYIAQWLQALGPDDRDAIAAATPALARLLDEGLKS